MNLYLNFGRKNTRYEATVSRDEVQKLSYISEAYAAVTREIAEQTQSVVISVEYVLPATP